MPSREASGNPGATYRFYFNIGSVDSFERKMEEAQEDMGLPPASWVGACIGPGCLFSGRPAALNAWRIGPSG